MKQFYLPLFAMFLCFVAKTQQITISGVGTVTTSNTYGPFNTDAGDNSNRHAYIYPASLLTGIPLNASITSISFERTGTSTATVDPGATLKIYLFNTTTTDFGTADLTWATAIASATLVFDGDPSAIIGNSSGWKEFVLTTPFAYTGGNLGIYVEYIQTGLTTAINWGYNSNGGQPAYSANQTKYTNSTTITPPATLTSEDDIHPNLQLNFTASCQNPTNLVVVPTTSSLTANWNAPAGGDPVTEYQWEIRTSGLPGSGATGLVSSGNTAGTTANISSLTANTNYIFYVRTACTGGAFSGYASVSLTTRLNNECAGATTLTVNSDLGCASVVTDSTTAATQSLAGCTGTADDDVWFKFAATNSTHRVKVFNKSGAGGSTSTDLVIELFSGSCGTLTSLVCSDPDSISAFNLNPGTEYFVRVYNWSIGGYTKFDICVGVPPAPPANDDCANAISLTPASGASCASPVAGSTFNATPSTETAPTCSATGTNDDVWYTFVATSTTHFVNLSNTSSTTAAAVYSGSCGTLTQVTGACASTNVTVTGLTVGQTYYVRVYTTSTGTALGSNFDICISSPAENDNCSGAFTLPVSATTSCSPTAGSTTNSSQSSETAPSCSATGVNDDVWYKFTATGTAHNILVSNASNTTAAAVYSGSCGSLTQISGACASGGVTIATGLTAGTEYFVRVYTTSTSTTTFATFDICVTTPPANDNCSGAVALPTPSVNNVCSTPTSGSTTGATSSTETAPSCSATGTNDDVWYSFVATGDRHTVLVTNASSTTAAAIYSGSCGGLTQLTGACGSGGATTTGLTAGQTYYVRVYTTSTTVGTYSTFDICVISAPANDECANAQSLTVSSSATCTTPTLGSTAGATGSTETAPSCSATGTNDDVWYSFVATQTTHTVSLYDPSTTTAAAVYSGSCGSLTQIIGACASTNTVATGLTVGETYYVRVYSTSTTATTYSNFGICIGVLPANDECANAVSLAVSTGTVNYVAGSTVGATASTETAPTCSATGTNDDVWYSFVATAANHVIITNNATSTTAVAVYSGSCGSLTQVTGACGSGSAIAAGLTPGSTYYVRAYTTSTTATVYSTFGIAVVEQPANDDCGGAPLITQQPFSASPTMQSVNTAFASTSTNTSSCFSSSNDDDLWYRFTATSSSLIIRIANYSNPTEGFNWGLYTGTCPTLTEFDCDLTEYQNGDITISGLTVGTQYYLRVMANGTAGRASFDFALLSPQVLPVQFTNFSGSRNGNINVLRWTTASEQNTKEFAVERSADGVTYQALGKVTTRAANGNSATPLSYTFTDAAFTGERQYYRLRQIDLDGRSRLSNIIVINGSRANKFDLSIFPNPVSSTLMLMAEAPQKGNIEIIVIDGSGRVVRSQKSMVDAGTNSVSLDVAGLIPGHYLVKMVLQSTSETAVRKFVKY